jgi:uncharacterized Zn finger protein
MSYYRYFPKSRPRQVKGGIKAQSKRGKFTKSWWANRWIEVLESFNIGARLGRGRRYARKGQVLSIDIKKGLVTAKVQGSRKRPYKVEVKVKTLKNKDWEKLVKVLSKQAFFTAKLLAGEMPEDIEKAFQDAGLSLFPTKMQDLQTECSCPDWSNPCKHIAAVYYLLGEEFDRDPFWIFKLRGTDRNQLLELLNEKQSVKPGSKDKKSKTKVNTQNDESSCLKETLPEDPESFWGKQDTDLDIGGEVSVPPIAAGLPKRLGGFPFWRSEENFIAVMEDIYSKTSDVGLNVFLGRTNNDKDEN